MAVSSIARARTWINDRVRWIVTPRIAVPVTGAAVLLVGSAAGMRPTTAYPVGVGIVAAWATAVLVRAALALHRADHSFVACRGAGFVGMAALATGLTAALPAFVPDPPAALVVTGLAAAGALYAMGTMLLPGAAGTLPVRLRRAFDGLGLGISLCFAAWLMPVVKGTATPAVAAAFCATAAISTVVVTVLRALPRRRPALHCGAGAVTVLVGLWIAVTLLVNGGSAGLPVAGLLIVAGLGLTVDGASRHGPVRGRPQSREADPNLAAYPLLAVPAAVGLIAAVYHVIVVGSFDRTAIALGLAMVGVLTMRELLAVRDIRGYARRLKSQEAHFRSLVAGATDLTLVLAEDLRVRWQSPASARLFGLADADVLGRRFTELIHPDDVPGVQAVLETVVAGEQAAGPPALVSGRLLDGHGLWRDTESTVSDQRSVPEVAALVVHVRDVGERRHLERTLHRLSYADQLTGLANRRALMRDLLSRRQTPGRAGTLLVIDLHGLAEINTSRGRETGDAVLIEAGRRIRTLVGEEDIPVRLGGDEFAVLTAGGAVLAYAQATRLVTLLAEPYQLPGTVVELHISVGLAEVSGGADSEEVLRHADLARSRAAQLGRGRVEWYDAEVEALLHRRMDLEQQLIGAAERGELDLVFQPVLTLPGGQPVGVEALVRWRHPSLGTILPAELLPIAEAVGCTAELGDWVLDAACRRLLSWSDTAAELWISVNVAPRELLAPTFPGRVAAVLARHGLAPDRLVVEVAETWIAEDLPAVVAALANLRKLGVRAALDDFGAGHASLSHLRRLPVDMLKLDRSLLNSPSEHAASGPAVIDVVVSLGRRLGLEIVAKCVETAEEADRARTAGCRYAQGFALVRPAPAERIEAYLDSHRASSS